LALESTVETKTYPILSGTFLIVLALALVLVSWAVGTETYPYIHRRIVYRFPLATLDRVYLVALGILAAHYAAYVAHYLLVGSRQQAGAAAAPRLQPGQVRHHVVSADRARGRLFGRRLHRHARPVRRSLRAGAGYGLRAGMEPHLFRLCAAGVAHRERHLFERGERARAGVSRARCIGSPSSCRCAPGTVSSAP